MSFALAAACSVAGNVAHAEFSLNFLPYTTSGYISTENTHGDFIFGGQTPYLMNGGFQLPEYITDPDNGQIYYHMIVGDEADGFIQETYIQAGYRYFQGGTGSAVGGDGDKNGGNGRDPLSVDPTIRTANAEATPRRVLIRQLITDGEISMEYLKDRYEMKPRITQVISTSDIQSQFEIDMRNISYSDMNTVGMITNTLSIMDAGNLFSSFDMATDAQNTGVTAGRYIYTDGSGPGGANGEYTYYDGGYDHRNQHWELFFDPSQDNPWAYNDNKP